MKSVLWRVAVTLLLALGLMACGQPVEEGLRFYTADPGLTITLLIPGMETGLDEPDPMPAPPCDLIKGNISQDGRMLYHAPGMPNYDQVKIDEAKGERFFCSEAEAQDAGWIRAGN